MLLAQQPNVNFASGLPKSAIGVGGGAMDIAFLGETAYVLITLVNPLVGGNDIDGIYRVDGPNSFTVVADVGRWSVAHPPKALVVLSELADIADVDDVGMREVRKDCPFLLEQVSSHSSGAGTSDNAQQSLVARPMA